MRFRQRSVAKRKYLSAIPMRIGVFLALIISTSRRLLGCAEAIDGCTHAGASSGATYNTTAWQLACLSRLHRSRIEIKVATRHLSLFRKLACPGGGVDPGPLPAPDPARVQQGSLVSASLQQMRCEVRMRSGSSAGA